MTLEQTTAQIDRMLSTYKARQKNLREQNASSPFSMWPSAHQQSFHELSGSIDALEALRMGLAIEADQRERRAQIAQGLIR